MVLTVLSLSHVDALIVCGVNTRSESPADSHLNSFAVCLIMCLHHEWCDDVCHAQEAQQLVPVLPLKCFRRVYLWLYLSTTFTQTQPAASTQLRSNGLSIITLWLPWLVKAFCNHVFGAQRFISLKPEGYREGKKQQQCDVFESKDI